GTFDGVHRGHRALLARMRDWSAEEGRDAVVVTFFPPAKVVFQGASYLTTPEEKIHLLRAFDPAAIAVVPFGRDYAKTPKEAFLAQLTAVRPRGIVVGEDFRFGRDRAGGLDDLQHVPDRLEVFRLREEGGAKISSSRIRAHLAGGEQEEARHLLGGPYLTIGTVQEGDRRGRTLGFPTANVQVSDGKALPLGVHAVSVVTPNGRFGGMANVGPRPSFPDGAPSLEVHLFDYGGDLYGSTLEIRFLAYLRGQRRFSGVEDLSAQLRRDRDAALAALAERADPARTSIPDADPSGR
ncbi:MAG: riboflavin biosynthesis protein RibF, partial [Trueperaceae bacterium]